ncbi:4'-phosphopantetheinyl transferase family protein [Massilia sp. GER05]|uniref:4'-phosphopantetheinyl transferase family protein n=1 Tax=Massilia sp. GER05 TaxID=3394605 RepID=UPI003F82A940
MCHEFTYTPVEPGSLTTLTLDPGQIDIWIGMVDETIESGVAKQLVRVLSEEERRQQARFLFEKDQRRYLVTRALVRYVLSRYVPLAPEQWRFGAAPHGRPFILNDVPQAKRLNFNISHSGQVVLMALTRDGQLGIDVEETGHNVAQTVADHYFAAREIRQLRAASPAEHAHRFLEFWTLKESYIKARGMGLSIPLQKFGFELGYSQELRAFFDPVLDDAPNNWTFWQWCPSVGSIGALCARRCGVAHRIAARRVVPFAWEENILFDLLRVGGA